MAADVMNHTIVTVQDWYCAVQDANGVRHFYGTHPECRAWIANHAPAGDMTACEQCQGSGYGGHPDSGQLCSRCSGAGAYRRQKEPPMPAKLNDLLRKLRKATGGSDDLDREVALALGWTAPALGLPFWHDDDGNHWTALPDWSTSIDAALALVERRLPGSYGAVQFGPSPLTAHVLVDHTRHHGSHSRITTVSASGRGSAKAPTLAILIALIEVLLSLGAQDVSD